MTARQVLKYCAPRIRRISPGLYDFTIKLLFSETVRSLRTLHKLPGENRLIAANSPQFAVDVSARMGMGALMSWAVGVLAYCDDNHLLPRLIFTNPVYASAPGEDWLSMFFVRQAPLCSKPADRPLSRDQYIPPSMNLLRRMRPAYARLTLERAHDLFFDALNFRKELREEADAFCKLHKIGSDTIGVHFRGTDKRLEATRANWNDMADAVEASREATTYSTIFVATDEPEFLQFMNARFGAETVIDLGCQEIFSGKSPHLTEGDPRVKGSEAIRTIIVLSRCGLLIRTRSYLSAWAKILNPSLPVIVFGETLSSDPLVFPEHLIRTNVSYGRRHHS